MSVKFGSVAWVSGMTLKQLEKNVILQSYANNNQVKSAVARELDISLRKVQERFQEWDAEDKVQAASDVDQAAKDLAELHRHRYGRGKPQPGVLAAELPEELTKPGKQDEKLAPPTETAEAVSKMVEAEQKAKARAEKK